MTLPPQSDAHNITSAIVKQGQVTSTELAGIRILVIMPSIPVQGMERANLQIMKMMHERGADVLFITEQNHGHLLKREVETIGCRWRGASLLNSFEERLHFTKNPLEMAAVLRAWSKAAWQIHRIYKEYKPTHIYVADLSYVFYALSTLALSRQPVIFRLPNPPDTSLQGKKRRLSDWLWRFFVVPVCDRLICNSQYTYRQLQEIGVSTEKVRVIYNCVPERRSSQESDAPRVHPAHFNIVFLGRITRSKGVQQLFEAARRLICERDDVDFYLAGEYHWKNPFAEALIEQVRAERLDSRIRFTGQIEDVSGLLAQCRLHVLPSIGSGESFSNAVLEAKSQGVPSVVFPTAGLPEAVTHLVDGYVCREKSASSLYEGIRYYLDNPCVLKTAGEAAKRSLGRFSREGIADQWVEVFTSARTDSTPGH
jgi:glycosyltransferase involved in cell wall biosynthesis